MSVTFSIEGNATGAFTADCYADDALTVLHGESYPAIVATMTAHKAACDECASYGIYSRATMDVPEHLDVNVSNVNARMIAVALGVDVESDGELVGRMTGEAFLGSVLLALASDRDDSGVRPTEVAPGARGATMIDCGQRAGYWAETLGNLHALALEAVRLGREIHWA